MSRKILLAISVVSLIFIVGLNTVSIFTASHSLTNISQPGNQISCETCHSQIQRELNNSTYHRDLTCEACHRYNASITFASDNGVVQPGNESHAAYLPRCLDCHGGNGVYIYNKTNSLVYAPPAKAFNLTNYGSNYSAHKKFVIDSNNFSAAKGENEACLSCHADYKVNISFVRPLYYNFSISSWTVSVNAYGNDNTTLIFKNGNGSKHLFKSVNQITCEACHSDIWLAINHTETSPSGSAPNSSHAIWWWSGGMMWGGSDPMHDPSEVGVAYTNITDYCLSSCHNATVLSGSPPPALTDTVHVARRISCYNCHTDNYGTFYIENKPGTDQTPDWSTWMDDFDTNVFNSPLFLHADTCISCKRAGAPSSGNFVSYSEPNNTVYYNGGTV